MTELAFLLDSLTFLDDIKLVLKQEDKNKEHLIPMHAAEYKLPAFQHQLEGIEWGLNTPSGLLLDEAGLGKSATIIHLAEELKAQRGLEHCLIICAINTLKANWKKEIALHSNLSCRVIGEKINSKGNISYATVKERAAELKNPLDAFFYIINIEAIRSDDVIDAIKNSANKIDMIVLDEAHKCLSGDTLIDTNLGKLPISYIVDNDIQCSVKCFNSKSNLETYNKVLNRFNNGNCDKLLKLTIKKDSGEDTTICCTPDHLIATKNRGFVKADELSSDDNIILC